MDLPIVKLNSSVSKVQFSWIASQSRSFLRPMRSTRKSPMKVQRKLMEATPADAQMAVVGSDTPAKVMILAE